MRSRVLFVIGTLDLGGAERQLVELASHLDRTKFTPAVCCLFGRGALVSELDAAGVPVFAADISSVRTEHGFGRVRALLRVPGGLLRFWRIVRRVDPDVLHGVLFQAYVLGAFVGRLAGVPVVVASRRSLSHFKRDRTVLRRFERLANRLTDAIVANSEAVRRDAVQTEHLPVDRVEVIYNGLAAARYEGRPSPALADQLALGGGPVLLVLANLIPYKGHAYFLPALVEVRRRFPTAVALLVGDGPARGALEAEADRLGLSSAVRFLGSRTDVPDLLALADLLVHPSTEEGFCNALIEAMAAGKPVVATDVGGNAEAVVSGETGWIVPARDPERLAAATIDVLARPDRGRAMGEAGRRRVRDRFDRRLMVQQYEALYARLLASRERAAADVRDYATR